MKLELVDEPPRVPDLADEVPEPDAEREEVEERLEDAREDHHPRTAVHHQIAFEEQAAGLPANAAAVTSAVFSRTCAAPRRNRPRRRARVGSVPQRAHDVHVARVNMRQSSTPCQSGVA